MYHEKTSVLLYMDSLNLYLDMKSAPSGLGVLYDRRTVYQGVFSPFE